MSGIYTGLFDEPGQVEDVDIYYATIGARIPDERLSNYVDFNEPRQGRKTTEAETYLREVLKYGPKLKQDIIDTTDLTERTLQRAAEKLGVSSQRANTLHGPAIWELPDEAA